MNILCRLICIAVGYCFGLIQSGYIYGKLKGVDIRTKGSGNAGSTNTLRVFGTKAGFTVLFFDALKTIVAIWVMRLTLGSLYPDYKCMIILYTATGVILGHNFPFYLNFKGGKGMAATLGLILSLSPSLYFVTMFPLFVIIFLTTHYVSLGSMMAYVLFVIETIIFGQLGLLGSELSQAERVEMDILAAFLMCLAIFQHRTNVKRLLAGEESKTYLSKKGKEKYKASIEAHNKELV